METPMTYDPELRARIEDEFCRIDPKPVAPWQKRAEEFTEKEFKKAGEQISPEGVVIDYASLLIKNSLDFEAVYAVSFPDRYKEYNRTLKEWSERKKEYVANRLRELK